jgi:hypothetical protein
MTDDWRAFELDSEVQNQLASGRPYREFLRVPTLSCGITPCPSAPRTCRARTTRTRSIW